MEEQYDKIAAIKAKMPDEDTTYSLAELFKALGDPTRAKILSCLQFPICASAKSQIFST